MHIEPYYVATLKNYLKERQEGNASYSLRSFARDLGLDSSSLSQILQLKRPLPRKLAPQVCQKLRLSPQETTLFMESFYRSKTTIDRIPIDELDRRFMLDESYYRIIAEWEHYAFIEAMDFLELAPRTMANYYGISQARAEEVIKNLLVAKLVSFDEFGKLRRCHAGIKTTEDVASNALKKSHLETLDLARQKLEELELHQRDYSSSTLALDPEKIPEAKIVIREFRQKMESLLKEGNKSQVYQLAVQFFPLNPRSSS